MTPHRVGETVAEASPVRPAVRSALLNPSGIGGQERSAAHAAAGRATASETNPRPEAPARTALPPFLQHQRSGAPTRRRPLRAREPRLPPTRDQRLVRDGERHRGIIGGPAPLTSRAPLPLPGPPRAREARPDDHPRPEARARTGAVVGHRRSDAADVARPCPARTPAGAPPRENHNDDARTLYRGPGVISAFSQPLRAWSAPAARSRRRAPRP